MKFIVKDIIKYKKIRKYYFNSKKSIHIKHNLFYNLFKYKLYSNKLTYSLKSWDLFSMKEVNH
jgi:hypothetical protein